MFLRERSGADIKIEEPNPEMNDRVITIKGTEEQINYAQFLMQQRYILNLIFNACQPEDL